MPALTIAVKYLLEHINKDIAAKCNMKRWSNNINAKWLRFDDKCIKATHVIHVTAFSSKLDSYAAKSIEL